MCIYQYECTSFVTRTFYNFFPEKKTQPTELEKSQSTQRIESKSAYIPMGIHMWINKYECTGFVLRAI